MTHTRTWHTHTPPLRTAITLVTRVTPIDRHYSHMKFSATEKVLHTHTHNRLIHLNITHGRRASRPIAPA